MQTYEFYTTAENGFIRIPDEYKKKVGKKIKVTVVNDEQFKINTNKKPKLGCMKGKIRISEDFDEPLEDFKEYM